MNSIFDDLVVYLLVSVVVFSSLALIKTKRSHYIFSLVVICLGLGVLYHSYFSEKPSVENYKIEQIQYNESRYEEESRSIVLKTSHSQYEVDKYLIEKVTTINEAVSILSKNTEADVWVTDLKGGRKLVRGLETETLSIPISYGMELDDPSNLSMIGWLFLILGILIFFLTLVFGDLVISHIT